MIVYMLPWEDFGGRFNTCKCFLFPEGGGGVVGAYVFQNVHVKVTWIYFKISYGTPSMFLPRLLYMCL